MDFFVLAQVLPLLIASFTNLTYRRESSHIYEALQNFNFEQNNRYFGRIVKACLVVSVPILVYYLFSVPWRKTGLYQSFTGGDAYLAVVAREESLKLTSAYVRYSYVFFNKTLSVIVAMYCVLRMKSAVENGKYSKLIWPFTLLAAMVFLSSLSGARSHGVYVILGSLFPLIVSYRFKFNPVKWILVILVILSIPVVLQLSKFNKEFTIENIALGYETIVFHRTLSVPIFTGIDWVDYVQRHGHWGMGGVSFLKSLSNDNPVVVSNFMMNYYNERASVQTGLMNTSFLFSYYSYFGYVSFLVIVPLVLLLDIVLSVIIKFRPLSLKLVAVCSCCLACINLVNTEYHTIFLSYGYATGMALFILFRHLIPSR